MARIFMSYNRESEKMALSIVSDLESMGHTPWFDQDLSGGQAWWYQILSQIRESEVFLFVMDNNSLDSTACKKELAYAAALGKPIVPVLVADGVSMALLPPELVEIHFIDYRKQDRSAALSLAKAFNSLPAPKPLPDPLPPLPDVPGSYLGEFTRKIDTADILSREEQSNLVFDLKRSLKETSSAEDARTLLKKLRSRRDLYAAVAEDIDELLREPVKMQPEHLHTTVNEPEHETTPVVKPPKPEITPGTGKVVNKVSKEDRLKGASIGVSIGAVVGILSAFLLGNWNEYYVGAIFTGISGGIVGAISGKRRSIVQIAVVAFCIGVILWILVDSINDFDRYMRAIAIGGSICAILGAIIGVMIHKKKQGGTPNPGPRT